MNIENGPGNTLNFVNFLKLHHLKALDFDDYITFNNQRMLLIYIVILYYNLYTRDVASISLANSVSYAR